MYCVKYTELNLINSAFVDVKLLSDYVMDKRIIVEDTGDSYTATLILGKPSMELGHSLINYPLSGLVRFLVGYVIYNNIHSDTFFLLANLTTISLTLWRK